MSVTGPPTPASVSIRARVTEELHQRQCAARHSNSPAHQRAASGHPGLLRCPPTQTALTTSGRPASSQGSAEARRQDRRGQPPVRPEEELNGHVGTHMGSGTRALTWRPRASHFSQDPRAAPAPDRLRGPELALCTPQSLPEPTHQARRQRDSPTCPAGAGSHEACGSSATGPER